MKTSKIQASVNTAEDFDWDCSEADTQYLTHGIHRYSGKFIPQIAQNAIQWLTKPGDLILDPYCGSGTTLLECALSDRLSIGVDLSPLAILIAQAKTCKIEKFVLDAFSSNLKHEINALLNVKNTQDLFSNISDKKTKDLSQKIESDPRRHDPWYTKWFCKEILDELITLKIVIDSIEDERLQRIGLIAFSDILRKSSNAHKGYPNVMYDKNHTQPPPATPRFIKRLNEIITAVQTLEGKFDDKYNPVVMNGDATNLPFKSRSVDAIITHPPYIGSIPYAEYGLLSITWLGYNAKELDAQLTGGKRQSSDVVNRFERGFGGMIQECSRVLKSHSPLFMLLGDPVVKGKVIDLSEMAIRLAADCELKLNYRGMRGAVNRRANKMGNETYLVFYKEN